MKTDPPEGLRSLRARPHWSFSQINGLLNFCSLAWAFHYVYKAEPESTPVALVFGGAFHRALAFHMTRLVKGSSATVAETSELFADLLRESLCHSDPPVRLNAGTDADALTDLGQRMLAAYLAAMDPTEKIVGVSVPFCVPLFDAAGNRLTKPLIGEYDLTVEKDGMFTIVDWKTSARRWADSKARNDLQPTCYLYARYIDTGDLNVGFRFDVVTKTAEPGCAQHFAQRDQRDFMRLGELVRVLERMVEADCFYPSDGSWECGNCPYTRACHSWHRDRARAFVHFELVA